MLRSLTINNFRSHKSTTIQWDKLIVYAAGLNGSGKTTIKEAIQMLFLDRCSVLTGRGEGKELLVRQGANDYNISAELDPHIIPSESQDSDETLVQRGTISRTKSTGIGLGATKLTDLNKAIQSEFGSSAAIEICTGGSFFDLTEEQQRTLLLTLARVVITESGIKNYLRTNLDPQHYEAIQNSIEGMRCGDDVAAIKTAHKYLYDLRSFEKKQLDEKKAELDALRKQGQAIDLEQAKAKLAELQSKQEQAYQALTNASNPQADAQRQMLLQNMEQYRNELKKLKPPKDLDKLIEQRQSDLDGKLADNKTTQVRVNQFEASAEQYSKLAARFDKLIQSGSNTCPVCTGIINPEQLKKERDENAKLHQQYLDAVKVNTEEILQRQQEINSLQERLQELRRIQQLYQLIQECESKLNALPPQLAPEKKKQLEAAAFFAKEELQQEQESILPAIKAGSIIERVESDVSIHTANHKALDAAVDIMNGYRKNIMSDKLGEWVKKLNAAASLLGIAFNLDPETLLITTNSGLQYRALSESEKIRVDTVFRTAIAFYTGIRFIVIDRADVLDKEGRLSLLQMLIKAGMKALVLTKIDGEDFNPNPHNNITYLWIKKQDGQSVINTIS